jgi:hypothetical protein
LSDFGGGSRGGGGSALGSVDGDCSVVSSAPPVPPDGMDGEEHVVQGGGWRELTCNSLHAFDQVRGCAGVPIDPVPYV